MSKLSSIKKYLTKAFRHGEKQHVFIVIFASTVLTLSLLIVSRANTSIVKAINTQVVINPFEDAHVRADIPTTNYGTRTAIEVDGSPLETTYLKFNLPSADTLLSATLRLYVTNSSGGPVSVRSVTDNTWQESTITYNTRPLVGSAFSTFNGGSSGTWIEVNVTSGLTGKLGQTVSLAMDETNSDGIFFSSKESSTNRPELILQLQTSDPSPTPASTIVPTVPPLPTPTPIVEPTPTIDPTTPPIEPTPTPVSSSDPIIVAAGDMVADLSKTPGSKHVAVSDLIISINPAAVLALGDVQYENGEYTNFTRYYEPSWGRFVNITYPTVGNHEYNSPNTAAQGYFDYYTQKFGGEGNTSQRPGARGQGYYSFDVGNWHLIALNTQCSKAGGCGVGSPQERWLRADLAAHTNRCVLAFWHIPLYSSGGRANSNSKAFWQALYDFNADLVLTGHDHTYERFAPMNANSGLDNVRGIRSFVVGTGGKNHTNKANNAPNSQLFNNDSFGVLKLTLHPESYDWQFQSIPGNTLSDSGSASCN